MKRIGFAAILAVAMLAGCSQLPTAQSGAPPTAAQQQAMAHANLEAGWYRGCYAWSVMQPQVAAKMATLPVPTAVTVLASSHQLTNLCKSVPADPQAATVQVMQALTKISILAAIQMVQP